jgi:adenylate cyclase
MADYKAAGLLDGIEDEQAREMRVQLLDELVGLGFSIDELKQATGDGRLALLPVDRVLQHEQPTLTSIEVADRSGLPLELLRRLWRALGLADAADDAAVYTESDLEAARTVAQFRAAGLDEEALIGISRVLGRGMSGLADTLRELVGEALLQQEDTELALGLRYAQAADYMLPMLEPLLKYVLSVHLREQIKSDVIFQEELRTGRLQGTREISVCFADLVGFTALGERVAPHELGSAGRRLTEVVAEAARPPVRLVKTIGDAAMLVSPEPEPLVEASLRIVELTNADPSPGGDDYEPRVRIGMASGEAVLQSGDWFGAPVNLASRVTAIARPMSVLATRSVREATRDSFSWSFAGRRRLRGVRDEVRLYRARRDE